MASKPDRQYIIFCNFMTGINYVTNDKGEKAALLLDLVQLREAEKGGTDIIGFPEDLADIIAAELSIGQAGSP